MCSIMSSLQWAAAIIGKKGGGREEKVEKEEGGRKLFSRNDHLVELSSEACAVPVISSLLWENFLISNVLATTMSLCGITSSTLRFLVKRPLMH